MAQNKTRMTVWLDKESVRIIKRVADQRGVTEGEVVRDIIHEYNFLALLAARGVLTEGPNKPQPPG